MVLHLFSLGNVECNYSISNTEYNLGYLMSVRTMQRVAEHSLFKAALPIVTATLIGSITWIFVTVMELDKVLHKIEDSELPQIRQILETHTKQIENLETMVTDLRIKFAELSSPGHPSNRPYYPDR